MKIFLMHVGSHNSIDLAFTVSKTRTIAELLQKLPQHSPERPFFESQTLPTAFSSGRFNCWGIPEKAAPSFEKTQPGDLVLFFPEIGANGGLEYIGVIKCMCRVRCYDASRILWPETPNERLFPWLFFFDAEKVKLSWEQFLTDVEYQSNWNPRGWYRQIGNQRFLKWGGEEGYLAYLRQFIAGYPQYQKIGRLAEELQEDETFLEGARKQITVNAYERDPRARQRCIQHYGARCFICGFAFGERYGTVAEGFIHVHHLRPLSEIGAEYTIDPVADLRPVCPNCHAVLHIRKPAFSIQEVIDFIQQ